MKKIMIINGVNLNMLGIREKGVYGSLDYKGLCGYITDKCKDMDVKLEFFQSNIEGEVVNCLHRCYFESFDGIVINPGAHTHYSYAIYDAIKAIAPIPVIEVHISDIHSREPFRQVSVTAPACVAQISGKGYDGYIEAVGLLTK
ncbi:MAG: 3-dehydroquinate dehydratase [Clostridia bacterium]|nr:3-dehydroquinate dehydratase [Clostridia bacterium]MDE6605514.1 3-dehydroquinate dehydratase [Clostridia bacterium]